MPAAFAVEDTDEVGELGRVATVVEVAGRERIQWRQRRRVISAGRTRRRIT